MPSLLLRQSSTTSLSTIVEKSQRTPLTPPPEYDLQLRNGQLELTLLSKPPRITTNNSPDEGFESDIDSISLISSENESFLQQATPKPALAETDSANGGSGTESDNETEKTNTLTQKNVNAIKECFEKQTKPIESHDLLDCICYTDITYKDILILLIKNEAYVFRFNDLNELKKFYTNFSTLKAVSNQKVYNPAKNLKTNYNLLQRTDNNGVTHIEITRNANFSQKLAANDSGPSSIISIETPEAFGAKNSEKQKNGVDSRQRECSKVLVPNDDVKYSTVNTRPAQKKLVVRCSSIENILSVDDSSENLVKNEDGAGLRKVWNSAEDLLSADAPKRPERRKKKKPAPQPPVNPQNDVFSGQYVRVNVNFDSFKDTSRLILKTTPNEPHPKKLQNFNLLNGKSNIASFLRPSKSPPQVLKYTENQKSTTLTRTNIYEKNPNSSWTNSVPRILKKSTRSKSETRTTNFQPMAYRYIDTTADYHAYKNNATPPFSKGHTLTKQKTASDGAVYRGNPAGGAENNRLSYAYSSNGVVEKPGDNNIGNRLFGLTPKLREFGGDRLKSRWSGSVTELNIFGSDKEKNNNHLKSVIKSDGGGKKKEKKVTFSAYTTVQVV